MTFDELIEQIEDDISNKTADESILPGDVGDNMVAVVNKLRESSFRLNVKGFGAVGDGVTDDTGAIQAAIDYCLYSKISLYFPSGVYRITDTVYIGYEAVDTPELIEYSAFAAPSFVPNQANQPVGLTGSIIIEGDDDAVIYCDFDSETLKAGWYYGLRSTQVRSEFSCAIRSIKFFGQGAYTGTTQNIYTSWNESKNVVGFACVLGYGCVIDRVYAQNFSYGILMNQNYGSVMTNISVRYCANGLYERENSASIRRQLRIFDCGIRHELNAGCGFMQIYNTWLGGGAGIGMKILSGGILVDGLYSELDREDGDNDATIVIGEDSSAPAYDTTLGGPSRLVFRGCNISAQKNGGGRSNGVFVRATAGIIVFENSQIVANIEVEDPKFSNLIFKNTRVAEGTITGPNIYQFDDVSVTSKAITALESFKSYSDIQALGLAYANSVTLAAAGENLVRYSDTAEGTGWTKSASLTKTLDAGADPYGGSRATGLKVSSAGGRLTCALENALEIGAQYCLSVWVRSDSANTVVLGIGDDEYSVIPVTTSWQRVQFSHIPGTGSLDRVTIGVSNVSDDDIQIFGVSFQKSLNPGPYVSTTSAAKTTKDVSIIESEERLTLRSRTKKISAELPSYADNAAAILGGLSAGDLYQSSGTIKIVT